MYIVENMDKVAKIWQKIDLMIKLGNLNMG
jgi:hypothetical protein